LHAEINENNGIYFHFVEQILNLGIWKKPTFFCTQKRQLHEQNIMRKRKEKNKKAMFFF